MTFEVKASKEDVSKASNVTIPKSARGGIKSKKKKEEKIKPRGQI